MGSVVEKVPRASGKNVYSTVFGWNRRSVVRYLLGPCYLGYHLIQRFLFLFLLETSVSW